jgi:hypothetical protein
MSWMEKKATLLTAPLKAGEDRFAIFHDGREHTAQLINEVRELAEICKQDWARRGWNLRRSGIAVASDQLFVEPMQPIMMVDGTQITGTTEASVWPIEYSSVAAGFLHKAQQHQEICAWGVTTTPASAATTCTVTPRWGTSTAGSALGASAASATVTASKTNVPWYLTANNLCRSIGTGATSVIVLGGDFICDQIAIPGLCFGGTVLSTVDKSAASGLWFGATLAGSASWTLTARALLVKNVS